MAAFLQIVRQPPLPSERQQTDAGLFLFLSPLGPIGPGTDLVGIGNDCASGVLYYFRLCFLSHIDLQNFQKKAAQAVRPARLVFRSNKTGRKHLI